MHVVVTSPFDTYKRGDRITDEAAVKKAIAEHPHSVIRVKGPATVQSVPKPKK